MAQQIDRLEAWKILLMPDMDRESAMLAMYELEDGVRVQHDELLLWREGESYWIEQKGGGSSSLIHAAQVAAVMLLSETEVPDLSHLYPVDPATVNDLITEAMADMEALAEFAQKYLAETDDEEISARLKRLKKIASAMISELQQT